MFHGGLLVGSRARGAASSSGLRNRYGEVGAGVGAEFFDADPQIVGGFRQHKAELIQRAKGLLEPLIEQ